jgi:hypothetical protein
MPVTRQTASRRCDARGLILGNEYKPHLYSSSSPPQKRSISIIRSMVPRTVPFSTRAALVCGHLVQIDEVVIRMDCQEQIKQAGDYNAISNPELRRPCVTRFIYARFHLPIQGISSSVDSQQFCDVRLPVSAAVFVEVAGAFSGGNSITVNGQISALFAWPLSLPAG